MQNQIEASYYAVRASSARALADKATDAGIRQIHIEMATQYEMLAHGDDAFPFRRAVE
ncbi:hypothetical protein [Sphingomonas psychrolutea]|uniref:Uncharacterized protein n=1 Tax=Sphingomonas psychrolutea TaxID=1259676 RepID=A0ABQ1H7K1_9SPHN|nr:hypothetical protein [Sphingomonas psychrolutea]GGA62527.1 hypothetical protein GCM10011395_35910 [Sphingomonas psychrolutea]